MKYLSLDLETTSLIPSPSNILMLSFVLENTKVHAAVEDLPHFTCFVRQPVIAGQAYALGMNAWILDILSNRALNHAGYPIYEAHEWQDQLVDWMVSHRLPQGKVTLAGKNVASFDLQFLPPSLRSWFSHRVIDVGSRYVDLATDDKIPDLKECLRRADIHKEVAHDAREDAMDVIRALRAKSNG